MAESDPLWGALPRQSGLVASKASEFRRAASPGTRLQAVATKHIAGFQLKDTRDVPWQGCPAGRVSCGITSDGKVKGCLSLPERFVEGDLRERDLWDIWFAPGAFPYSRGFSKDRLGPNCQGCDLVEVCRGGCSAMSFGATGCFQNNPLCFYGIARRKTASQPSAVPV